MSMWILTAIWCFATLCISSTPVESDDGTSGRRPNILWVIAENAGPDLGCYGASLVNTPYLDQLASEGLLFSHAFATSPVCSPSRSAFMTGFYQTSIGAHNHRSHRTDFFPLPSGVLPITDRLRAAGYYTANIRTAGGRRVGTGKTDLNFDVEGKVRHKSVHVSQGSRRDRNEDHNQQNEARLFDTDDWEDLLNHRPFFAQVNLPVVELGEGGWTGSLESPWYGKSYPSAINPDQVEPPPYYPDHPVTRREWAKYLDAVSGMDRRVGEILDKLADDGLIEETIIVFFSDNGRLTLRGLDWCYDSGDRVPLILRWPRSFPPPRHYQAGATDNRLVSLIDIAATTLDFARVEKPGGMHGRILLGPNTDLTRRFIVSARDRCDEAINRIRAVRTDRYRYIRNFMPEKAFMALHRYKAARYPVMQLMFQLNAEAGLTPPQKQLMAARLPDEELYDLKSDPFEINNLAVSKEPEHQKVLRELRETLACWIDETNDEGRLPESPRVVEYWTRVMHEQYGIPDWYHSPE